MDQYVLAEREGPEVAADAGRVHKRVFLRAVYPHYRSLMRNSSSARAAVIDCAVFVVFTNFHVSDHFVVPTCDEASIAISRNYVRFDLSCSRTRRIRIPASAGSAAVVRSPSPAVLECVFRWDRRDPSGVSTGKKPVSTGLSAIPEINPGKCRLPTYLSEYAVALLCRARQGKRRVPKESGISFLENGRGSITLQDSLR